MIKVLRSGLHSSIQDLGRFNYRKYGVPVSGAIDAIAAKRANVLLQNTPEAAVLEVIILGPKLEFLVATNIAISGGDGQILINDEQVAINCVIEIHKGDILDIGPIKLGACVCIAVKGGIKSETVLGSRSYFNGMGLPIALVTGTLLAIDEYVGDVPTNHNARIKPLGFEDLEIMVYTGPEYHKLNEIQMEMITTKAFTIGAHNRMGYFLNELVENNLEGILTGPVLPGTVQLTPSGTLIILMNDAQTTGGYPRILVLSEASRYRLAQKKSKEAIKFTLLCQKDKE